jgi:hypothetical protein
MKAMEATALRTARAVHRSANPTDRSARAADGSHRIGNEVMQQKVLAYCRLASEEPRRDSGPGMQRCGRACGLRAEATAQ